MSQAFDPRQYMMNQSYEIFHYYDTRLDNVELHHHDFYEIYLFLNGNVDYFIENRSYHLLPSDMLLINPRELHQPRIAQDTPYERIVLWVSRAFLLQFSTPRTSLAACFDSDAPNHTNLLRFPPSKLSTIKGLMLQLIEETQTPSYGGDLASLSLLIALLVEINRAARTAPRYEAADTSSDLVSSILDYINRNYGSELSLDSIASRFFVSKYHLSHEFNRLVGTSVHRYILQKRLAMARQMLADGAAPTDVYQPCGFNDYANFYRAFKKIYNISPREYAEFSQENANPWEPA